MISFTWWWYLSVFQFKFLRTTSSFTGKLLCPDWVGAQWKKQFPRWGCIGCDLKIHFFPSWQNSQNYANYLEKVPIVWFEPREPKLFIVSWLSRAISENLPLCVPGEVRYLLAASATTWKSQQRSNGCQWISVSSIYNFSLSLFNESTNL